MSDTISSKRVAEILRLAFTILKENGGSMEQHAVVDELKRRLTFTPYEQSSSNGKGPRWLFRMSMRSVEAVKADWLIKDGAGSKSSWRLTLEGKEAMERPLEDFSRMMKALYRRWEAQNKLARSTQRASE